MHRDGTDRIVDAGTIPEEDAQHDKYAGDAPMTTAAQLSTNAQGAVIATSPASMPLHIIEGSGFMP